MVGWVGTPKPLDSLRGRSRGNQWRHRVASNQRGGYHIDPRSDGCNGSVGVASVLTQNRLNVSKDLYLLCLKLGNSSFQVRKTSHHFLLICDNSCEHRYNLGLKRGVVP